MRKRFGLAALVAVALFSWGVLVGVYRVFPWNLIYPVGEQVNDLLRGAGLLPPEPIPRRLPAVLQRIDTGLLNLDVAVVNDDDPIPGNAGGMSVTTSGLLIGRRPDGRLDFYDFATGRLRALPFHLPSLAVETVPERFAGGRQLRAIDMRYHDVEVIRQADGDHLLVSYNYYDPDDVCFAIRLQQALLPPGWEAATGEDQPLDWRLVHQTTPCLPPSLDRAAFGGNQGGGRIVAAPDGGIYLTTGDLEYDGVGRKVPAVSQLATSTDGRVLHFDLATGAMTEISRGHRNPQGLTIDAQGRLWLTEHAAQGGDELNLIVPGRNYGWPIVTLGVHYTDGPSDAKFWPGNLPTGHHDGFTPPRLAWIPSIAPSAIALVEGISSRWDGDLLVTTLAWGGLRRLRLDGDRVLYDEPIPLRLRLRDIAVTGGHIYLLLDDGRLAQLTPHQMLDEDPNIGQTTTALTDLGCLECHANPVVPRLSEVFERDIAAQPGVSYSEALRRVEGTWTRETLAAFLASPQSLAPGTTMPDPGLSAEQIATLVEELRTVLQREY